ncbi:MATH domain and coiled-coil domain-containing protein At3g58270 [Eutrema salsugineum]|uniref:MATH domain and coiled-coil domain-containing protein At3g58270 n=1 Tax=Eutrema salsugineum TaxID=72664 RepID=UPI000CECF5F5|nr:MATH domain and coiled-coil domain-containing protein At3g58270 [Eutrema salsugineum]XP_024012758.1 MATH domain and coiled-coil domain-containing protein At3g58270 [Eutrema salsugineum]
MGKEVDKKFSWVIKNFCSVRAKKIYSDEFVVDGCKWRLLAFPKGNNVECLSLYLDVACSESLPSGWKRNALLRLSIVNQVSEKLSETKATQHWFDATSSDWGFTSMFPLSKLHDKDGGFLVNGELNIVASVDVLEVIGKLDVPDESEEATKSLSKLEEDDGAKSSDFLEEASPVKESMDVNEFQVLPSQVESVSRILERHPDIASKLRPKNQHLRSANMSVLLSLIETLCQSTQELSKDDLADAEAALEYLTKAGLNLNWLEEKLEQVSAKKEKEEAGETRMQEIEEELKDLKLKCSNLEAQLEKEKEVVSLARASLSFDDVV